MICYVKNFGRTKAAVCEETLPNGMVMTATEYVHDENPSPSLWAKLGALIAKTGELVEAQ